MPAEVRHIVREEIEAAVSELRGQGDPDRDEAIHEARKHVKKVRGVLRLMRPELGEVYIRENSFFRDVGLQLSHFRDAGAMLEVWDGMREHFCGEMGRLASIRRGLVARKQEMEQQGGIEKVLRSVALRLSRSARRVEKWPLAADGFEAIAPGLEDIFRRGRKAMAAARELPSPENWHAWRKRVKDHWYHVRLLEAVWDGSMPAYERRLKDLETWLGEDHNLVVLREKVTSEPNFYSSPAQMAMFVRLIGKYQRELRASALELGGQIYEPKAQEVVKAMRKMWDARAGAQCKSSAPRRAMHVTAGSGQRGDNASRGGSHAAL